MLRTGYTPFTLTFPVFSHSLSSNKKRSDAREPEVSLPLFYQICVAKCPYSDRDDPLENLFKTTAQDGKKSTSGWRSSLKNVVT